MSLDELPSGVDNTEQIRSFQRNRASFRDDSYHPAYHFVPPGGILHDPNGACYWNGRYHVFYQFWPPDLTENREWNEAMHWGHAASTDLVHWQDLPVALSADTGPEQSCYSGQALVEDDRVILMYHGPGAGNCIATSSDPLLESFEKHPDNPVIPIDEDAPYRVFDPCLWKEKGTYYSLSGSYLGEERGNGSRDVEFLFASDDLSDWEYLHPLVEGGFHTEPSEDGAVPNFFSLGEKTVLLFFSHTRGPQYYVGEYDEDDHTFDVEGHGRMNFGPVKHGNLHAPSTLEAPDGRRIAFFNVQESLDRRDEKPWESWSQVLSLPRVLELESEHVTVTPPSELTSLRTDERTVEPGTISANSERLLDDIGGRSIEIHAQITPDEAAEVGIRVLRSSDGAERTTVSYWDAVDSLGIDTGASTSNPHVLGRTPEIGPLELSDGEPLDLRVFVDRSVIEVFANGRQSLTTRVYPSRDLNAGISLFARRGAAKLDSMTVWDMRSIWDESSV